VVSLTTPVCNFGWKAKTFKLVSTNNALISLEDAMGPNGLLVMFICNHCPYVKAILPRLIHDTRELKTLGINTVAISSNDVINYPEDSFENMKKLAKEHEFPFDYCFDETQAVAKSYDAICTPDFLVLITSMNFSIEADLTQQDGVSCQITMKEICLMQ
jgi:peroxiredoxin